MAETVHDPLLAKVLARSQLTTVTELRFIRHRTPVDNPGVKQHLEDFLVKR